MNKKLNRRLHKKCIYKHKINSTNSILFNGEIGIFSLSNGVLTKEQIECCRVIIRRECKKKGGLLIRCNFLTPITSKPTGVRMGKGKGAIKEHINFINIYDCLFELKDISLLFGLKLLKKIAYKLGIDVCIIDKNHNIYYAK